MLRFYHTLTACRRASYTGRKDTTMRSFYTDPLGYTADICLMTNRSSARVIVRSPEGSTIYTGVYPAWIDAVRSLRFMLPRAINDMTLRPIIDTLRDDVRSFVACVLLCDD